MTQEQMYCFEYVRDHRTLYERYALQLCLPMPHIAFVFQVGSNHLIFGSCTSFVRWLAMRR